MKIKQTMKTIEERAEIFVDILMGDEGLKSDLVRELLKEVYVAAATQERELITEWNDDIDTAPYHSDLLLLLEGEVEDGGNWREYAVGYKAKRPDGIDIDYFPDNFCIKGELRFPKHLKDATVIKWREIHE